MILKDNLYRILNLGDNIARIRLLPDSEIYRAHFPGCPITPGVCIIQTAAELLAELTGLSLSLQTVSNAKFLAVIDPEATPEITYDFIKVETTDDGGTVRCSVTVRDEATTYSKLSLTYRRI